MKCNAQPRPRDRIHLCSCHRQRGSVVHEHHSAVQLGDCMRLRPERPRAIKHPRSPHFPSSVTASFPSSNRDTTWWSTRVTRRVKRQHRTRRSRKNRRNRARGWVTRYLRSQELQGVGTTPDPSLPPCPTRHVMYEAEGDGREEDHRQMKGLFSPFSPPFSIQPSPPPAGGIVHGSGRPSAARMGVAPVLGGGLRSMLVAAARICSTSPILQI
jgi:hypothetical protein